MEKFTYVGRKLTSFGRICRNITSLINQSKIAFSIKKNLLTSKTNHSSEEESRERFCEHCCIAWKRMVDEWENLKEKE